MLEIEKVSFNFGESWARWPRWGKVIRPKLSAHSSLGDAFSTLPLSPLSTQLMRPLSIQPKPCHPVLLSFISSLAAPLSPPCHHVIISEWRILSLNPTLVTTTRHECFPRVARPLQFHSFQHEWTSVWDQPRL